MGQDDKAREDAKKAKKQAEQAAELRRRQAEDKAAYDKTWGVKTPKPKK
jgi:hypothetical protein